MSEAKRVEGKPLAQQIQTDIQKRIEKLISSGNACPKILGIQTASDPSAEWYMNAQAKLAAKLGIEYEKVTHDKITSEADVLNYVRKGNADESVHGIFISMPLPEGFDADKVLLALDPAKDIEGIHPTSLGLIVLRKGKLIPPTAYAAYKILKSLDLPLRGKKAAVVGQSAIVGRPLQMLLGQDRVTTTVCNTGTSEADLKQILSESDIVMACAGQPKMIQGDFLKPGAVVIDVGTTEVDGKLQGDVDYESAIRQAGFVTPVPGGVGPLTTTMLMANLMAAYEEQQELQPK